MPKGSKKYLIGIFILVAAVGYTAWASLTTPKRYYVTVSELFAPNGKIQDNYRDQGLKVAGNIAPGRVIRATQAEPFHSFIVEENHKSVRVIYRGPLPDQFKEGGQVVVSGRFNADNTLVANEVLVKCASKYEAQVKS